MADMIDRPDPSNSPDPKMSTAGIPILAENLSSASSVWSLWALCERMWEGPLRFPNCWNARKVRGQKSLTATLRGLDGDGLVRSITAQVPIRVDYEAPALGLELIVKFQPFWSWCGRVRTFTAARRALTRHTGVRLDRGPPSAGDMEPNRS
jgi:DNA-binding HxlR family transcriptional regulator